MRTRVPTFLLLLLLSARPAFAPDESTRPETRPTTPSTGIPETPTRFTPFDLKSTYGDFVPTTVHQNESFLDLAEAKDSSVKLYFHVENAVLKVLNDKYLKDRELSQAAGALYKKLLFDNLARQPILGRALVARFSDYKTVRLALGEDSPEVRKALVTAYEQTAKQFAAALGDVPAFREATDNAPSESLVAELANWHLGGFGQTADEAGWASRRARDTARDGRKVLDFRSPEVQQAFEEGVRNAEAARLKIQETLSGHKGMLVPHESHPDKLVLSDMALDILRGAAEGDRGAIKRLKRRFRIRLGVELGSVDIVRLLHYMRHINLFVPNINVAKHDIIHLANAEHGFIAIDLTGQNVRNLREAMTALADIHSFEGTRLERAGLTLDRLRQGQDRASREFSRIQSRAFEMFAQLGLVGDTRFSPENGIRISGDDLIFAPARPLTEMQRMAVLTKLADLGVANHYRVTFAPSAIQRADGVSEPIPELERARFIVIGDTIEKGLRRELEGKLTETELRQIIVGVVVDPKDNRRIDLSVLVGGEVREGIGELIRDAVQDAVDLDNFAHPEREPVTIRSLTIRSRVCGDAYEKVAPSESAALFPSIRVARAAPIPLAA